MKEFMKVYRNISCISVELLNFGMKIAISVLLVGIFVYKYNELFIHGYKNALFSMQIVQTAWNLFVIFVLGAIAIDCYEKSR